MYHTSRINEPTVLKGKRAQLSTRAYDSFEQCGFELNHHGTIMSDFAQLVNSQSLLVMQQAAHRLQEIKAVQPDTSQMSHEELVSMVRPRWCQSPLQMQRFDDYLIEHKIAGYEELLQHVEEQKTDENDDAAASGSSASE